MIFSAGSRSRRSTRRSRASRARRRPSCRACAATGRSPRPSRPTGTWTWCTGRWARPGVILVGEGSPTRLASLLAAEKKRIARVAYEVPIYDFQVGERRGPDPDQQAAAQDHEAAAQPQAGRGQRPELPAQGAAAVAAGAEGADARGTSGSPRCPGRRPAEPGRPGQPGKPRPRSTSGRRWCLAARSCRPRRSRSVISGGITVSSSSRPHQRPARTRPACRPAGPPGCPAAACPRVNPVSAVSRQTSTAKTARVQNCEWSQPDAMSMLSSQSMNSAQRPGGACWPPARAALGQAEALARIVSLSAAGRAVSCAVPAGVARSGLAAAPGRLRGFLATTPRYPFWARWPAAGHDRQPDLGRRRVTPVKHVGHGTETAGRLAS